MQKIDFDKRILEIENCEEVEQRIENASSAEEVGCILNEVGLIKNEEEAHAFASIISREDGDDEINEEQLEQVAGGFSWGDLGKIKKVWDYCKKAFELGKKFRDWVDNLSK